MAFELTFIDGDLDILDQEEKPEYKEKVKRTFEDFGLKMLSFYIPEPAPKLNKIDLPFSSGSVDLTDALGETPYNDRDGLNFEFKLYDGSYERWEYAKSQLAMFLHGKRLKMIVDSDLGYYYVVRLEVDSTKSNKYNSTIVLKGSSDPFKYDLIASNDPWKWDSFNFFTGIIQDTSDITVAGTRDVNIIAGAMATCPEFYVSKIDTVLYVEFEGKEYEFNKGIGKYRFPQIKISGKDATLKINGYGKVSIAYRGRYL